MSSVAVGCAGKQACGSGRRSPVPKSAPVPCRYYISTTGLHALCGQGTGRNEVCMLVAANCGHVLGVSTCNAGWHLICIRRFAFDLHLQI